MTMIQATPTPRYQTIKDFLKDRSWPTKSSIRWYIFYNKYKFEDRCVKRVGKKILIDCNAFDQWIDDFSNQQVGG